MARTRTWRRPPPAGLSVAVTAQILENSRPPMSDIRDVNNWVPAFREFSGRRVFILELGNGGGRGLVHNSWSAKTLLFPEYTWAAFLQQAPSDQAMVEGTHYVRMDDWAPVQVRFQRGNAWPITAVDLDTAESTNADSAILSIHELPIPLLATQPTQESDASPPVTPPTPPMGLS